MTCRKRSNDPVLQGTDQVQQDDHNDRNASQPEDDVAEHGRISFRQPGHAGGRQTQSVPGPTCPDDLRLSPRPTTQHPAR